MNEQELSNEQKEKNWICDICSNTVPNTQDYCNKCGLSEQQKKLQLKLKKTSAKSNSSFTENNTQLSENPENSSPAYQHAETKTQNVLKNNKKVIAAVLAVAILIGAFAIYWFNFRGEKLTTENYYDYLTISLSGSLNSYEKDYYDYYTGANIYGSINGISGYKYEDVMVVIEVDCLTATGKIYVHLNLAGNAVVSEEVYFDEDVRFCSIVSYEVVSITGKVIKN